MLKALLWLGSSRHALRNFPDNARRRAGYELYLLQSGLQPSDWNRWRRSERAFKRSGCIPNWNIASYTSPNFEEAIYVLHAFEKKSRKTPRADLELAQSRLTELLKIRRGKRRG
jgi:phage-related protein